eukprot:1144170-Pelagomonas_calceolata.AAC.5
MATDAKARMATDATACKATDATVCMTTHATAHMAADATHTWLQMQQVRSQQALQTPQLYPFPLSSRTGDRYSYGMCKASEDYTNPFEKHVKMHAQFHQWWTLGCRGWLRTIGVQVPVPIQTECLTSGEAACLQANDGMTCTSSKCVPVPQRARFDCAAACMMCA